MGKIYRTTSDANSLQVLNYKFTFDVNYTAVFFMLAKVWEETII